MSQLDDNVAHGKACYQNAQEVIRFVDSKTGIMTGVVTVTTGIPLAIIHFVISRRSDEATTIAAWINEGGASKWLVWISATFMFVGFACGVLSLVAATSGLMARRPRKNLFVDDSLLKEIGRVVLRAVTFGVKGRGLPGTPEITCLFPLFKPKQRREAVAKFDKLETAGYSGHDILREYSLQLASVGSILETKISRNRKAVQWFEGQIVAYAISMILSGILIFVLPFCREQEKDWDPTEPGHAGLHQSAFYTT